MIFASKKGLGRHKALFKHAALRSVFLTLFPFLRPRAGKSTLILEQNAFGGQIATAPRVENFPSVNEIAGARLADNMFEQAIS